MDFDALLKSIMGRHEFTKSIYDDVRLIDPVSKAVLSHIRNSTKE